MPLMSLPAIPESNFKRKKRDYQSNQQRSPSLEVLKYDRHPHARSSGTVLRPLIASRLRFSFCLKRRAVALRHLVVIRAIRAVINLAVAIADDPAVDRRSRRRLIVTRFTVGRRSELP